VRDQCFWVVRVPQDPETIETVRKKGVVAIRFGITEDIAAVGDFQEMKALIRKNRPQAKEQHVGFEAGQMNRIVNEIKDGDWILTPLRDSRTVLMGKAEGNYFFKPKLLPGGHCHARKVNWKAELSRDDMSAALRGGLGAQPTILDMSKHATELLQLMHQPKDVGATITEAEEDYETSFLEETRGKAVELIGDLVAAIDPYDLQDLVAGLLQAMGYRTRVSERGPDQGVDIVAHPDALGFESPRIKVQVKHRRSPAGGPDIRNLVGTLGEGEKGLFVSTGGFTTEARNEARRNPRLTLVNAQELVELLTEHYEQLETDYKTLVPLRKVWIPVSSQRIRP